MGHSSVRWIAPAAACLLALGSAGCTRWEVTRPARSAMEQRLISTAVDRSARRMMEKPFPDLGKAVLDASNFEGYDKPYAVHAIRRELLAAGVPIVDDEAYADTVVEIGVGTLSIDYSRFMIGVPAVSVPLPVAGQVTVPELSLLKRESFQGVAKFSISARDRVTGQPKGDGYITIGTAFTDQWSVLLFIGFTHSNLPDKPEETMEPKQP